MCFGSKSKTPATQLPAPKPAPLPVNDPLPQDAAQMKPSTPKASPEPITTSSSTGLNIPSV